MVIKHAALKFSIELFWVSTVSRARPSRLLFPADGKSVRIVIGNGSGVGAIRRQLASESANWIIPSDSLAIEFIIQQWRRTNSGVGRQYRTLIPTQVLDY